jgi:ligand-binding sensor domain-containing protein
MREFYPKELEGQVVTAILRFQGNLWVGTQKRGLFRIGKGGRIERYGFAAGLPDSWVTALAEVDGKLAAGVADGGVCLFESGRMTQLPGPSRHVLKLAVHRGYLVIGGQEGTWLRDGRKYQQLSQKEAVGLVALAGRLAVGAPDRLSFWR